MDRGRDREGCRWTEGGIGRGADGQREGYGEVERDSGR